MVVLEQRFQRLNDENPNAAAQDHNIYVLKKYNEIMFKYSCPNI